MIIMAIKIFVVMMLIAVGIMKAADLASDIAFSKDSKITDYGCREDFSQRYEDDPWSMFRG